MKTPWIEGSEPLANWMRGVFFALAAASLPCIITVVVFAAHKGIVLGLTAVPWLALDVIFSSLIWLPLGVILGSLIPRVIAGRPPRSAAFLGAGLGALLATMPFLLLSFLSILLSSLSAGCDSAFSWVVHAFFPYLIMTWGYFIAGTGYRFQMVIRYISELIFSSRTSVTLAWEAYVALWASIYAYYCTKHPAE